ncbi:glycoside hydrolase family 2 TIM barrel-domain containing protein [Paenibacillus sp. M1]|uniref:Glycoside hydrolase family 2 TIM barrel-domain containing protein n=1 Tax=Paenibacillus haidiansis TaxID=1574488 RepID=A0ABU7VUG0_9BACL
MSRKKLFNNGWLFTKQPLGSNLEAVQGRDTAWNPVTLPHDWLIYDANHLYEDGEGWYRKSFTVENHAPYTRISLRFEGVYMNSTLYVNGHEAGTWKYGYSTFEIDITPYLSDGDNEIYVRVVHEAPNSRWYTGAGIYRNVWLKTHPATHLVPDGIYISARKTEDAWNVEVDTEMRFGGQSEDLTGYRLRHSILDASGAKVAETESEIAPEPGQTAVSPAVVSVADPVLWDIAAPYCYTLKTELIAGETVTEEEVQTFGFRTMEFDSEQGFFLNGRHVKLQGVCQHHDMGCLGAAVNKAALRRQIALLQEMGVNAIRTAHNMPAVEFMELADEMGVLVVSEAFDMWERKKTTYDYARFFPEWWEKDVASWVRRDRNRPSMLMWSIGNEIYDTHADERGQEITVMLRDAVRLHDPKGNAAVTIGSNYMPWDNAQKCADLVKFAGYNYGDKYYELHHQEHPDWFIYGSETCSTVQSRGIYHFPLSQSVLSDDDEQCSSLGNSSTSWGAKSTESCIIADRDAPFSLGQFLWTGFDYIGEPTPYHTKNSYFGQLDTAGFKKDSFYIYQAEWTDYKVKPMVHIFPYWDFSEGQLIDVRVCSNAPRIELFFNDVSQGTFDIDHAHGEKLVGDWRLAYAKGVLRAVAYDEDGRKVAEDVKRSFGDASELVMVPDKQTIAADGSDLVFVEISAIDDEGNPVENANNRIQLTVEGPGRLVGLDNGDSTDYEQYKGTSRKLFSGKLLAVIASCLESGTITLRADSKGMKPCEIELTAVSPAPAVNASGEHQPPLYAYAPSAPSSDSLELQERQRDEIPIRKLELICPQGNRLAKDSRSLPVRVKIHPENATYQDVAWRITNAAGIDANIATLEANGHEAVITALGDGKVYVRCAATNGSGKISLYSLMEFHIAGMGQAYLNPYEFVSAGYHNAELSRNLTNGNERGVATGREGESRICFDKIDFGSYGSDEITLPIFSLDDEEFPIEIWEGVPGKENAQLLTRVTYQKPSIWNVYQEVAYRLPKRLRGITTLCFVLYRKIHLKGFRFTKAMKAYERLGALDSNRIYGDSYTLSDDAVKNIGNNVSLVFEDMDFGETGSTKLVICGHSPIDKNTIHILFAGPQGESKQIVEFAHSDGYCEREFSLERVAGPQTVTFVFLPGSEFDFKWFEFHRA